MRWTVVAVLLAVGAAVPLEAQYERDTGLKVLRHAPSGRATPGAIVTVTFDRPVAGALDRTVDASKVFRIEPAVRGHVGWRDPVTIRFVPDEPFTPGSRFTVTIENAFRAIDGSALEAPFRFTFAVGGPALLTYLPRRERGESLGPLDTVMLLYSAPVDLAALQRTARLELSCTGKPRVELRAAGQRRLRDDDDYELRHAGGDDRDTAADRFRRVVQLAPASSIPGDCDGWLAVPQLAAVASGTDVDRYPIRTRPAFRVERVACGDASCEGQALHLVFSTPVDREHVQRHVRLEPRAPLALQPGERGARQHWYFAATLTPRTEYRLVVDTAIRDVYGRRLVRTALPTIEPADRQPRVTLGAGLLTVARNGPRFIALRHVNVDTALITVFRVPDSQRSAALATNQSWGGGDPWQPNGRTTAIAWPLHASFNRETTTVVRLDDLERRIGGSGLLALQVDVAVATAPPESLDVLRRRQRPDTSIRMPFALVQTTDVVAHAKLSGDSGSVFVTGLADGLPRAGARVTLYDERNVAVARGTTNHAGVATLGLLGGASRPRVVAAPVGRARGGVPASRFVEVLHGADRSVTPATNSPRFGHYSYEWPPSQLDPERLGGRSLHESPVSGVVFTERGIYRPGEVVFAKAIVRMGHLGALRRPHRGDSLHWVVKHQSHQWDEDGAETLRDTVVALSAFGTSTDSFRLRRTAPVGRYTIHLQLRTQGDTLPAAHGEFSVGEYRAPEFLVDLTAADSIPRFAGDTVSAIVAARYLFGAPMGNALVEWSTTTRELSSGEFDIPRTAGWVVGERADNWGGERPQPVARPGQTTLDGNGRATLRIGVPAAVPARPSRLEVHAAVTDVNRQVVTASTSFLVHPAALYIAARQTKAGWLWNVGTPQSMELRTVRPDGSTIGGITVHATVLRRHWEQGVIGAGGTYRGWRQVVDTVARDTVITGSEPVAYTFTPRSGGEYRVRFTARDEHGRDAATALSAYAMGGGRQWWGDSPYRLPLVATNDRLAVGDTASVVFDSPFDRAEVWMTVEREGLLDQRRLSVRRGTTTLRIPLAERHAPNVFVSVLLVNRTARADGGPDSATQVLRAGYTELHVDPDIKRLRVSVLVHPPERAPGETASVHVDVRDRRTRGVKSEVALWAVDEGVLALTAYTAPDPVRALYEPRGLGARVRSTLTTLLFDPMLQEAARRAAARRAAARRTAAARARSESLARLDTVREQMPPVYAAVSELAIATTGMEVPLPAEIPVQLLRAQFRTTAFFLGDVVTDDTGRAVTRVKLPDNLTSYRVFAVAVSDGDRYGAGHASFLVTRPLVARPALPRFVRASDSLVAGPVVNARDGGIHSVRVDAESQHARLVGSPRQSLMLAPGRGAEARFTFLVPRRDSATDAAVFRFGAVAAVGRDAVETRLDVRPDFHRRAHTVIGVVRDSTSLAINLPGSIDAARSRLTLRVGTSPLVPMLAAYEHLRVYPYHCTEQLTSGGRALVALYHTTRGTSRRVAALGPNPIRTLQQLTDELAMRQREDGAIGFWRQSDWSSPWLSAYAGLFLLDARAVGVVVDQRVVENLAKYLGAAAADTLPHGGENPDDRLHRRLRLGERVAAVDFLRRVGRADRIAEDSLLARSGDMTWEDRLRLAENLASRPDVAPRVRALLDEAWRAVVVAGIRVDLPDSALARRGFPSRIRPAARLLTATLALRPNHPLIGGLVETVLQQGRAERYWAWNTQDYASVVTALAQLGGEAAAGEDRRVSVIAGGRRLLDRAIGSTAIAAAGRGAVVDSAVSLSGLLRGSAGGRTLPVQVVASGTGDAIFYALTVEEVPSRAPVTPDMQGIAVERWYERFDDGTPITSIGEGELVRVRLRVTVPADRQFVVVDDALPAGLEPVDLSLRTSATLGPFVTPESQTARRRGDRDRDGPRWQAWLYGSWDNGWWSPWDHKEIRDDRVVYFARALWTGTYTASYVARATTRGSFVRPPAHAEEMYNPGVHGRSDGGRFVVGERGLR